MSSKMDLLVMMLSGDVEYLYIKSRSGTTANKQVGGWWTGTDGARANVTYYKI